MRKSIMHKVIIFLCFFNGVSRSITRPVIDAVAGLKDIAQGERPYNTS